MDRLERLERLVAPRAGRFHFCMLIANLRPRRITSESCGTSTNWLVRLACCPVRLTHYRTPSRRTPDQSTPATNEARMRTERGAPGLTGARLATNGTKGIAILARSYERSSWHFYWEQRARSNLWAQPPPKLTFLFRCVVPKHAFASEPLLDEGVHILRQGVPFVPALLFQGSVETLHHPRSRRKAGRTQRRRRRRRGVRSRRHWTVGGDRWKSPLSKNTLYYRTSPRRILLQ